ncbi:MAG: Mg/Co/Ni transporter MgtE, partial [Microbacterium sp.]|nr:Mg/Co/Ni transporter MgtE [Microbacterium sp.]
VDDVLDYLLPDDWRTHDSDDPTPKVTLRPTATQSIPVQTPPSPRRR